MSMLWHQAQTKLKSPVNVSFKAKSLHLALVWDVNIYTVTLEMTKHPQNLKNMQTLPCVTILGGILYLCLRLCWS